ncbi:MAG: molybdopterin molybdotransferase MoeA [Desulfobacterales bacterium]
METAVGFRAALALTLSRVSPLPAEELPLAGAVGRSLAAEILARVDCPLHATSRRDGYAVFSEDLRCAAPGQPVRLHLAGRSGAGDARGGRIERGEAYRVTTGAPLPEGADAVLSEEYAALEGDGVLCRNTAETGRNVLSRGADVRAGERIAEAGARLTPPLLARIAASGHARVPVVGNPRVAVLATGSELVLPGEPLTAGKLYASNLVQISGWLSRFGFPAQTGIVPDRRAAIAAALEQALSRCDALVTCGGAWGSERDLTWKAALDVGMQGVYLRVRMSPGKPVGFGLVAGKPLFLLPGGPSANETAFLTLALPALLRMRGDPLPAFPRIRVRLAAAVDGERGWTRFVPVRLAAGEDVPRAFPLRGGSQLRSLADKQALVVLPEERNGAAAGDIAGAELLEVSDLYEP